MIKITDKLKNEIIRLYLTGTNIKQLAQSELFPGNSDTLRKYLKDWNVYTPKRISLKDNQEELDKIIELWNNGVSLCKLQKQFHRNKSTISKILKELGYNIKNPQLELMINEHVFDIIDTEEKAYWLGFMYADGNILTIKNNKATEYTISIILKKSDDNHLLKFNNFVEHKKDNRKYYNTKFPSCSWSITNKNLWENLNNKGCVPNKSKILKFPDINIFKDSSLIRHFIRGYFDGDGCISYDKYTYEIIPRLSLVGTKNMMENIAIYSNCLDSPIQERSSKTNILYTLKLNTKESIKFMHYLYDDCTIYLDRKYARYKLFSKEYLPLDLLESPEITEY